MPTSRNRGPKKKPRGKPFPKGVVQNPGGRPRYAEISKAIRHILTLSAVENDSFIPHTHAEKIAMVQIKQAEKTDGRASAQWVADRAEGMPVATTRTSLDILSGADVVLDILKPPGPPVEPTGA